MQMRMVFATVLHSAALGAPSETLWGEAFQQHVVSTRLRPPGRLALPWFPDGGFHTRAQRTRPHMPTGVPAGLRSALRHGVRHHAQDLEHQIGRIERGVARRVERGRHLTDISPNELQPP